jgi:hypothetical protein
MNAKINGYDDDRKYIRLICDPGHWFDTSTEAVAAFKRMCKANDIKFVPCKRKFYRYGDIPITWYKVRTEDLHLIKLMLPKTSKKYELIQEDEYYKKFNQWRLRHNIV